MIRESLEIHAQVPASDAARVCAEPLRRCCACHQMLPATAEYFYPKRTGGCQWVTRCKRCYSEYNRERHRELKATRRGRRDYNHWSAASKPVPSVGTLDFYLAVIEAQTMPIDSRTVWHSAVMLRAVEAGVVRDVSCRACAQFASDHAARFRRMMQGRDA